MVQYAVVFEAVYNSLKLGIDWEKLAEYKNREHWFSFSDYLKELADAYDIPECACMHFSKDVNIKEWFASEKILYRNRDRIYRIYNAVPEDVHLAIETIFSEFDEEFDNLERYGCDYIDLISHHIYGVEIESYFPCDVDLSHMFKCAYVIYRIGDKLGIK